MILKIYFTIGLLYSMFLLIESLISPRKMVREYWAGILLVGTLFWPIDLFVGNMGIINRYWPT